LDSLERGRVPSSRPLAEKETQLIDRVEEMRLLREAADRAVRSEGGVVFLYGEAGIGKTRLTRELGAYARLRGMQVLYGRCPALFKMDGVPPYVLWSEVIRDYLHSCTPEQLYKVIGLYPGELFKLVPEIKQKLRVFSESLPISPEGGRDRLFEAVSQFVTNISGEAPLLVILDDLQWTDQTSLLLLHYLARGVYREPLLLLGAYRDTDVDEKHPLTPVLTELNRERLLQSAPLKRMSFDDTSEMIKRILEQDDVSREFCELIYEKTRGNPFFAEEVIKSLKEEGVIYREDDKWRIKDVSEIEFPKTVKSVIKARIGRLDDECQNALTLASFIGNDFSWEALCEVSGIEEGKLLELIDKLLTTGLVKHRVIRGEDVCSFADIIVRDVVYEEVSPFRRKKLHNLVGCALEKVYAKKIDEHLGELALHFLESGEKDRALDYFLKAGDRAAKIYANGEAASYFQSALRLLEEKEGELPEKGRVLERLGDIKKLVGEYDACMKYWDEALLLWTKLQEKEKTATLHRKMANVLWGRIGNKEKAKEHHEAALKILEPEPESVELARLYEDVAHMLRRMGQVTEALTWAEKALRLAEKSNALEAVADSCNELAVEYGSIGDRKKSLEYANRALKIALDNNYLETAVWAYGKVGDWLPQEEYEKRIDAYEKGFALAKKIGDISQYAYLQCSLASEYMFRGEMDKAITLMEEALAVAKKSGDITYIPWYLLDLEEAYRRLGEWDKSEQYYKEAVDAARNQNEFITDARSRLRFALLHIDKEEYNKAKELLEEAIKIWEKGGARAGQMSYSVFLVWTLIELGDVEKAQNLLDGLQKFGVETERRFLIADEMGLRAMLFRAQKKYAESIELFEKTLKEWEFIKANIWNAYYFARWVLYEYARVYLERNAEGDKEKAGSLLNRALEMFQKMGAKKNIEKTITLVEALNIPSTQTPETTVSPKGHEVIDLQANIIATPKELKIGESLDLEIELTNTRKEGAIFLTKITEIIPEGFGIAKKPELHRMEDNCLNMKEKRLDPQETETVKLVLTPKAQGTFHIKPRILYINANGKEKTHEPKPASITVKELGIKGWLKGER
jgi:tetratricopeptide (TPR) repeat protein